MSKKVGVPAPLRQYCGSKKEIELEGSKVKDILSSMSERYSTLHSKVCEDNGSVRKFVNLYVNGVDIKKLNNLDTELKESDKLTIIPAVAGGL